MNIFNFFIALSIIFLWSCGKTNDCEPNPKKDCICTLQYDPVCGCDGVTYGNACMAGCQGVEVVSKGECGARKLQNNWNFIGYKTAENINLKTPTQKHKFNQMTLNILNEVNAQGEMKMGGKSAINFFDGTYKITTNNNISLKVGLTTRIAGTEEALAYEDRYINAIDAAKSFEYVNEGSTLLIAYKNRKEEDVMVFVRK
jgi:heat shock protein HslJ